MKPVIIIAIAFVLLIPIPIFAQEGSRNMMEEYCLKNLQDDPQCENFVSKKIEQNKASNPIDVEQNKTSNPIDDIVQFILQIFRDIMPEETMKDVSKTAKDATTETISKIKETIDEQLIPNHLEPVDVTEDNIKKIPVKIQEQNQLGQPIINETELEKQVHSLTNQYRIQNGLMALTWDDKLSNIARSHSQDMASRDYFSHDSPEGKDPTDRGTSQGYRCQKTIGNLIYSGIAENIFQNNLYDSVTIIGIVPIHDWNSQDDLAKSTVDGWMESPGHRENILTNTYDREGIGVEIASDNKVYITQNFC